MELVNPELIIPTKITPKNVDLPSFNFKEKQRLGMWIGVVVLFVVLATMISRLPKGIR